jgi:hypothetical protein
MIRGIINFSKGKGVAIDEKSDKESNKCVSRTRQAEFGKDPQSIYGFGEKRIPRWA